MLESTIKSLDRSPHTSINPSIDESLDRLGRDVNCVRDTARHAPTTARAKAACVALQTADALVALAIELLQNANVEQTTGLSPEMLLQLEGRRMGSEARMITKAASHLHAMPHLSSAFTDGLVSWSQVRAIVMASGRVRSEGRAAADQLIAQHACALAGADPDRLVQLVDDEVARQRADLDKAREDRQIDRSFLAIQGRLDGSAGIYGEADAQSTATIVEALDAIADAPHNGDTGGMPRAQQRFQALVAMCESTLSGGQASTRPRPRVLAVLDASASSNDTRGDVASLLWAVAGRPGRLTSVASETLTCDANVIPVLFDRGRPIAVGDATSMISGKVRTALIARDGGCRFPGCSAPASWCDAHHIIPGYGNQANDLVLLCRRCHRRVHHHRWRIRLQEDGAITFTRRGRTYTSYPRHRSPPSLRE